MGYRDKNQVSYKAGLGTNLSGKSENEKLKESNSESLTTSIQPNGYLVSNEALILYKAVLTILENSEVTKAVPSIKKTK